MQPRRRVLLHAANATAQGYRRVLILANDTDWQFLSLLRLERRNYGCHLEWARSLSIFLSTIFAMPFPPQKHLLYQHFMPLQAVITHPSFPAQGRSQVGCKTRADNSIMPPSGKTFHTFLRRCKSQRRLCRFTVFCKLLFNRSQPSTSANICSRPAHLNICHQLRLP